MGSVSTAVTPGGDHAACLAAARAAITAAGYEVGADSDAQDHGDVLICWLEVDDRLSKRLQWENEDEIAFESGHYRIVLTN